MTPQPYPYGNQRYRGVTSNQVLYGRAGIMNQREETRFWEKVIKGPGPSACWIWVGAIGDDGYGRFWTQTPGSGQRMLRAHRAAAEIIYGREEITGHLVTHLCDNPLWKHQGRAARATAARLLRAHTIQNGYDQRQVDELIRGIVMPGQTPLF